MKTWYVQRGAENVTICDGIDTDGNRNVRFKGTIDSALTRLAFYMNETDETHTALKHAQEEIVQLKDQIERNR